MMFDEQAVREVGQGVWCLISIFLAFVFLRLVALARRARPSCWRDSLIARLSAALGCYYIGSTIYRAWTWGILKFPDLDLQNHYWAAYAGTGFALVGALWMARLVQPRNWSAWVWIAAGVMSVLIPILIHLFI